MLTAKTHPKGQIVIPKQIREKLGIKPGGTVSIRLVDDHIEIRPLTDDPIDYLSGIFKDHPRSMAQDLLDDRAKDNRRDETHRL